LIETLYGSELNWFELVLYCSMLLHVIVADFGYVCASYLPFIVVKLPAKMKADCSSWSYQHCRV